MAWTCPCGTSNKDDHAPCRSCGSHVIKGTADRPQVSEDRREQISAFRTFAILVLIAGAGLWIFINWLSRGPADHNQATSQIDASTTAPTPKAPQEPTTSNPADNGSGDISVNEPLPQYQIGQEFSVGYFTYRVNRVETKSEPTGGPVLAIDVTIRNNDDSETMTPQLRLLDENGKDYGGTVLELTTPSGNILTELQPGVVHRGYAAFDVPTDRPYFLRVSGGITSGKKALVKLTADTATTDNVAHENFPPATPELITQARTAIERGRQLCISSNLGAEFGDLSYCSNPCSPRSLKLFNTYGMDAVERACNFLKANGEPVTRP